MTVRDYADDRNGHVYLVQCGSIYKIGYAIAPKSRARLFRRLQSLHHYPFLTVQIELGYLPEMIHTIPVNCVRKSERSMHIRFEQKRIHWPEDWQGSGMTNHLTEWFRLSVEDVAWFCSITNESQLQ